MSLFTGSKFVELFDTAILAYKGRVPNGLRARESREPFTSAQGGEAFISPPFVIGHTTRGSTVDVRFLARWAGQTERTRLLREGDCQLRAGVTCVCEL
jgi:hypothetical protein